MQKHRRFKVIWSIILLSIALECSCPAPADEPLPGPADLSAQIDKLFAAWNRADSPGCSVGIVQSGKLIYSKGYGVANLDFQAPNTQETLFEMASFSKTFTCICIALLMDEGKISPEDELRKFVPEMHAFDPPIRIRDLVRCRSGLWDQVSVPILVGWENAPLPHAHTAADFMSLLTGQKALPFKPGEQFAYSSGDYFLLGLIVKRVSGESLAQFANGRVFEPLGMSSTFFAEDESLVVKDRAVGHYKRGGVWHQWRPMASWAGGGGLKTCVADLYRWDQNFSKNQLPSGKYLDEILREGTLLGNRYCLDADAYLKETNPETRRDSPPGQYRGLRRRQFTGGAWGFSAAMSQFPQQEVTVICLSNCDDITAWAMNARIADLLLGDSFPQPPALAGTAAADLPTVAVPEAALRETVGAYRMKNTNLIWRIALRDGALSMIDHLNAAHRLRPLGGMRFDPEGEFYATTQFVFSRARADAPMSFRSVWQEPDNRGSLDLEPVQLVDPSEDELAKYAGDYESDELAATYRIRVRDKALWLRINSRRWEQLDATVRDEFIPHLREPWDGRQITFLRHENGEVRGLSAAYYRVKGVRFEKR
jgi:CubicO group peptidase (beta-lactamase class C family)